MVYPRTLIYRSETRFAAADAKNLVRVGREPNGPAPAIDCRPVDSPPRDHCSYFSVKFNLLHAALLLLYAGIMPGLSCIFEKLISF